MFKWFLRIFLLILIIGITGIVWLYISMPDVEYLIHNNPKTTAVIEQRKAEAAAAGKKFKIRQIWIRYSDIPRLLRRSVRITEDASFFKHEGFDFDELEEAFLKNLEEGKIVRGGSTITQQLAKNLYLSTSRSVFRKIREYFITYKIESTLSKNRIFHLYLNIIEFGPGIFGVEAAARYYFGKTSKNLTTAEIIRLTAVIPRPLVIKPTGNSKWLKWKCCWITKKMYLYKYINKGMYLRLKRKFC